MFHYKLAEQIICPQQLKIKSSLSNQLYGQQLHQWQHNPWPR